mgnify:CR=1 FL=1
MQVNQINMADKEFRIVFMGTPDFAVESLKLLIESNYQVVGVVTNPDKPAGRGQKIKKSPVKEFAEAHELPILQPSSLRDEDFRKDLKALNPSLQIVVAFKILPPEIFSLPPFGTFNLHASLLPDYRGAAPINHAIMNGETTTGITTFFLDKKVDTGKIIDKSVVSIEPEDTAGTLHDKLMVEGARLVVSTAESIKNQTYRLIPQEQLLENQREPKPAPKIFKKDCKIEWNQESEKVHNFIRGLSPYPAAWSELVSENRKQQVKIYFGTPLRETHSLSPGTIQTDGKNKFQVATRDGYFQITELQLAGKKRMKTAEFLRGIQHIEEAWFE